jgi:uncharacterized RDD family membrane protein YckC
METKYALVLTGSTLPGFAGDAVWPALAAYFRMEPAKLTEQVLVRAPLTIKESDDLGKLQTLQAGAASVGAEAEICAPDGRPALFVLLDGTPRGPVPRVLVEERVEHGLWPDRLMVAEVGSNAWRAFRELSPAPPSLPPEAVAEEPDIAATAARPIGYAPTSAADHGHSLAAVGVTGSAPVLGGLPEGAAINAGFWRRCAAYVIDYFITFLASYVVGLVAGFGLASGQGVAGMMAAPTVGGLLGLVIAWLYFALQECSAQQATLGKRALGIKVTDTNGLRIGFGRASGRFFGKILSGLIFAIGFMLAGWTARKQALHDMLAGTLVVFRDVQPGQPLPTLRPPMPWYGWLINILMIGAIVLFFGAIFMYAGLLVDALGGAGTGDSGF